MTDIYGTLGPSCSDPDILEQMLRSGMTGIRLNLSHTTLRDAAPQLHALRTASERCGIHPRLLIDMQGPELRIPRLSSPVVLTEGTQVLLGEGGIPVPESVLPWLTEGQEVLLDDGKLLLRILRFRGNRAEASVLRGGVLNSSKSIALPGSRIQPPAMTTQDRENILCAKQFGVTGIMQPFVRNAEDLRCLRRALNDADSADIRIFAKIENLDGVSHLEELIPECDEIVIARGDLGNAVPLWELPGLQQRISSICRRAGIPFMVVTQMLASMEHSPIPTRAEVSDIYHAVMDGASSVMVTGETAVGDYPAEVIRYLTNTVRCAERDLGI